MAKTANDNGGNDDPSHSRLTFSEDDRETLLETAEAEDVTELCFAFALLFSHGKDNIGDCTDVTCNRDSQDSKELEVLQKWGD